MAPFPPIGRRRFLLAAGGGALAVAGCSNGSAPASTDSGRTTVGPTDPAVAAAESARSVPGATVTRYDLRAAPATLDIGSQQVQTWAYDGAVPGRELRVTEGDILEVAIRNDLPEHTTIHWHGLALRNDMDGVHDLTQAPIRPGESFTYRFTVPDPGTYWFHPHMGLQLDRALYAPLIVEERASPGDYDVDQAIVLDDWLDGIGGTPEETFDSLIGMGMQMDGMQMDDMDMDGMGMGGMSMFTSDLLGGDAGDVDYPLHLLNGHPSSDPPTIEVPAGGRARLRFVNAGSDTAYRVAVGGHRMTVTHTDGFPIDPVVVEAVLIGMGERYDVIVEPASGAVESVRLDLRPPDVSEKIQLTGSMMPYSWAFDGAAFPDRAPVEIRQGQRVRLAFENTTSMWHPIHLHGHTFRIGTDPSGPRKDTVNVLPRETVIVEFDADNPGQWMAHCHNTFHLERGMAMVLSYVR